MLSLGQRAPAGCGLMGGIEGAALVQDEEIVREMAALDSAISMCSLFKKTERWKVHEILYVNFTKHFIADQ